LCNQGQGTSDADATWIPGGLSFVSLPFDSKFWYSWRNQIEEFSKTHKVVAVDLRGYNLTSKPSSTIDYNIDNLMLDIVELVKALGSEKCVLVSHDWYESP
jgi:pimeloyl-ACP methyl ester carboxylesterase